MLNQQLTKVVMMILISITSISCSSHLKIIDKDSVGEGIIVLDNSANQMLAKVISFPSQDYSLFVDKVNKFAVKHCGSGYRVKLSEDVIPIVAYECRSGGCGERPDQAYVFEIDCPNNTLYQGIESQ